MGSGDMQRSHGMRVFTIVWLGQTVSLIGSGMSWFAFSLWTWEQTGSATAWALILFLSYAPSILASPLAGVLVDRWNRKAILLLSDAAVAASTLIVLVLHSLGLLQVWHLYVIALVAGMCTALQVPAFTAAVSLMVAQEHYPRAQGMQGAAQALQAILAPLLAAALIKPVGLSGVLLVDLVTFLAALGTLAWVRIPQPPPTQPSTSAPGLWQEMLYGFRYIAARPGLRALLLVVAGGCLFEALGLSLVTPMLLARSGNDEVLLGGVQSVGAAGGLLGGAWLIVWGGPRRRIHGVLLAWALSNALGLCLMGLGTAFWMWALASFCYGFFTPVVDASDTAIWQTKVAPGGQGRILSTQRFLVQIPTLVGTLLAGPLADQVFEPALAAQGPGAGPGLGMAALMILAGAATAALMLGSYAFPVVRCVEDQLPDYDGQPPPVQPDG
jgi:DHA3 family macrolide efflux protein-like MFS transporter